MRLSTFLKAGALALAIGASAFQARAEGVKLEPDADTGIAEVAFPEGAKTLIVVLSGDGGWWGDIDRQLANKLDDSGYAVIALDTHIWFQKLRPPSEIGAYLSQVARDYGKRLGTDKVVFLGYSFGADALPLGINRLAPDIKAKLKAVVLVAPEKAVDPHVTFLEQTGLGAQAINLSPEFKKMPLAKTLCIYGKEQKELTGCLTPEMAKAKKVALEGGHHFDGDPNTLAKPILAALAKLAPPK